MLRLDTDDTIAAIATPPGPALRGLVRLSGPDAWCIAGGVFTPEEPRDRPPSRTSRLPGSLHLTGFSLAIPADLTYWRVPRTYTGQDVVEFGTTGSPPVLEALLADCLARGARLAEPGEFTLRAFLSGRIDLTRAEAVLGVIDADSPAQLDAALRQLAGGLAGPIADLRDRLLDVLAHLEAGLDFVDEEDVDPIARAELADELDRGAAQLADLACRLDARDRPEARPRVVLIGPPNAGKSRLFNALAGAEHALVSPLAGTTRDYLRAEVDCAGRRVELIDTAGLEEPAEAIAGRAQEHRARQAASADLLLACWPADERRLDSGPPDPSGGIASLAVATRCDLAPAPAGSIATSAVTGAGLDALRGAIAAALDRGPADSSAVLSTGARCRDSLFQADQALGRAAVTIRARGGDELVALDVRQALDELGRVVSATVTDDILDRIFSRFCIGK